MGRSIYYPLITRLSSVPDQISGRLVSVVCRRRAFQTHVCIHDAEGLSAAARLRSGHRGR